MMDEGGVQALVSGFWMHIIECLQQGDEETRLWLDTGEETAGFLWWCQLTDKDPAHWRDRLLRVWADYRRTTKKK